MRIANDVLRRYWLSERFAASLGLDKIIELLRIEFGVVVKSLDQPRYYARGKLRVSSADRKDAVSEVHLCTRELLYRADIGVVIAKEPLDIYFFRYVYFVFHIIICY